MVFKSRKNGSPTGRLSDKMLCPNESFIYLTDNSQGKCNPLQSYNFSKPALHIVNHYNLYSTFVN